MASITIRHLDDEVKTRLRVRASANGPSMEEEALYSPSAEKRLHANHSCYCATPAVSCLGHATQDHQ